MLARSAGCININKRRRRGAPVRRLSETEGERQGEGEERRLRINLPAYLPRAPRTGPEKKRGLALPSRNWFWVLVIPV